MKKTINRWNYCRKEIKKIHRRLESIVKDVQELKVMMYSIFDSEDMHWFQSAKNIHDEEG